MMITITSFPFYVLIGQLWQSLAFQSGQHFIAREIIFRRNKDHISSSRCEPPRYCRIAKLYIVDNNRRSCFLSRASTNRSARLKVTEGADLECSHKQSRRETSIISSASSSKPADSLAGENDVLPQGRLRIGKCLVLPAETDSFRDGVDYNEVSSDTFAVRLLACNNGWGTGVHPTTRLCLEWLLRSDVLRGEGERVLDYGCGSGILSIAALQMGASYVIGVDVEAGALDTAEKNVQLNG